MPTWCPQEARRCRRRGGSGRNAHLIGGAEWVEGPSETLGSRDQQVSYLEGDADARIPCRGKGHPEHTDGLDDPVLGLGGHAGLPVEGRTGRRFGVDGVGLAPAPAHRPVCCHIPPQRWPRPLRTVVRPEGPGGNGSCDRGDHAKERVLRQVVPRARPARCPPALRTAARPAVPAEAHRPRRRVRGCNRRELFRRRWRCRRHRRRGSGSQGVAHDAGLARRSSHRGRRPAPGRPRCAPRRRARPPGARCRWLPACRHQVAHVTGSGQEGRRRVGPRLRSRRALSSVRP